MRPRHCDAFNIEHGMEQTSMTNAIKKRLDRKGFTLAEVLVTVAIIIILAGVTFVSVVQYQKNLRLMEMDGTAKEIFIAAQNHLSVGKASGDLDRLAEEANRSTNGVTKSAIGTKLSSAPPYAGSASGEYYYVIHDVNSGIESYTPAGSQAILQMMLPFGALDETVAAGGNYAIVYELKSASVVAVLYSGAGNASFGNAAVINFSDEDVSKINEIYNDKSMRKSYEKNGVTAIVGCYTGTAGSAAIPTETLEAPKLEVKNENKLHVLVREARNTDNITLVITGEQSGTTARRLLDRNTGDGYTKTSGTFDVTLDDITGIDGAYRFCQLITGGRFKPDVDGSNFIPGENIIISAIASSSTALATPKESAKYTVSSLFDDVNETKDSAGNTTVYIKNLRHLENLGGNVSGFTAALRKDAMSGNAKVVNITAVQKNDITMFSFDGLRDETYKNIYGSGTNAGMYVAANVNYALSYDGGSHEIYDLSISSYSGGSATELNAGIFGNVTDKLSVKNLILRNDRILEKASATNAGMLVGKVSANLTVDGVLTYYHETEYNEANDSAVEVQASQVAGGLIGLVAGGKLDVKNSAAAVYVKGGSAAGGFIGSVDGAVADSTIVQSYAGGHTKNGAYSTMDAANQPVLEGAGRYNVQASGYAGGFIGVTTNKVQMDNVYATTSVYSSSYSDSNKCSGSFAGTGTLSIPAKAEKDGSTKKHYYALGPHNDVDVTKEELACAELAQGQAHRQATPYDRKLILKESETEHTMMDKTSYPLCTVRNLCEGDTSIKDADLPWFIKEHVGDWVASKKAEEPNFEVENGNRLTVRINTGLPTSTDMLKYGIKVHGETSHKDVYFLVSISNTGASVKKTYYHEGQLNTADFGFFKKTNDDGNLGLELYLDDITQPQGHFYNTCPWLIPGEDISVSVVSEINGNLSNDNLDWRNLDFSKAETQKTNSLFGYLQGNDEEDKHNKQKIEAVKSYNAEAASTGMGLVPNGNGKYYVQIDNSRHLENLSPSISGCVGNNPIGSNIIGGIQTDKIYWSGKSTAYTKGFLEELGENLKVWSKDNTVKTQDGLFSPLDYNQPVHLYDGDNKCIHGLNVKESSNPACLFSKPNSDLVIKNLSVSDSSFISTGDKASGLVGYTESKLTLDHVSVVNVNVQGNEAAGGFVAKANAELTIMNSSISGGKIKATNGHAGGIVGHTDTGGEAIITDTTLDGVLTVTGVKSSSGIIGNANAKATIKHASFQSDVTVTSTNDHAAGVLGCTNNEADIENITFVGKLIVYGNNSSGGIIGNTSAKATIQRASFQSDVTVTSTIAHAAGVLGYTENEADIENITFVGKLIAYGNNSSGGILGNTGSKMKLWNISIGGPSTITSVNVDAGGVVGYTKSNDANIQNVKFIGKNTEVIAKKNAGGLCGTLTQNSKLAVSNVAVSAFIQAEENAGGLIGQLNTSDSQGKVEKSYYGGRTQNGKYASITINDNAKPYTANIPGNQAAGGLIGYIENANGLTINQCFSAGSVENSSDNQTAGGFIGVVKPGDRGVNIKNCYSIGSVSGMNNGGFIGYRDDSSRLTYENAYYLNTFNALSVKAIGNGSDEENNNLTTKYADNVLGKNETVDRTVQTNSYDNALNGESYPYKNWTRDWMVNENPIAYYGDWPLPSKLTGELIYFYAKDSNNYKDGGLYKVTGQNTNVECYMTPISGLELQECGFGIISEYPITDQNVYRMLNERYAWSTSLDGEFKNFKIEGSAAKPEYSVFTYFGKTYYYYRCTSQKGALNIKNGWIYVKTLKTDPVITYKVNVSDGEAQFIVEPGA